MPYHFSNGDDGIFLPNAVDIVLDPDVGLDEGRHNSDTDTDMNFDGSASLKQFCGRDLQEYRDVDGSTDVSRG